MASKVVRVVVVADTTCGDRVRGVVVSARTGRPVVSNGQTVGTALISTSFPDCRAFAATHAARIAVFHGYEVVS